MKRIEFFLFYLLEVLVSNLRVARDVLSPRPRIRPAIVAVPLEPGLSDRQIMLLANLITMTPGTLSLDVSPERDRLFIHVLNLEDPEAFRNEIKENFEARIRNAF